MSYLHAADATLVSGPTSCSSALSLYRLAWRLLCRYSRRAAATLTHTETCRHDITHASRHRRTDWTILTTRHIVTSQCYQH